MHVRERWSDDVYFPEGFFAQDADCRLWKNTKESQYWVASGFFLNEFGDVLIGEEDLGCQAWIQCVNPDISTGYESPWIKTKRWGMQLSQFAIPLKYFANKEKVVDTLLGNGVVINVNIPWIQDDIIKYLVQQKLKIMDDIYWDAMESAKQEPTS